MALNVGPAWAAFMNGSTKSPRERRGSCGALVAGTATERAVSSATVSPRAAAAKRRLGCAPRSVMAHTVSASGGAGLENSP